MFSLCLPYELPLLVVRYQVNTVDHMTIIMYSTSSIRKRNRNIIKTMMCSVPIIAEAIIMNYNNPSQFHYHLMHHTFFGFIMEGWTNKRRNNYSNQFSGKRSEGLRGESDPPVQLSSTNHYNTETISFVWGNSCFLGYSSGNSAIKTTTVFGYALDIMRWYWMELKLSFPKNLNLIDI